MSGVGLLDAMRRKRHTFSALLAFMFGWGCQTVKQAVTIKMDKDDDKERIGCQGTT